MFWENASPSSRGRGEIANLITDDFIIASLENLTYVAHKTLLQDFSVPFVCDHEKLDPNISLDWLIHI